MPKIQTLTPKKILAILTKMGFEIDHVTGSHYILHNSSTKRRVVVPFHKKDLPKGTMYSIIKMSGIDIKNL